MMKERMSHAIDSWLPLSTVAAGITIMAGSILNLPFAKTMLAAVTGGIATFSAFLMRSCAKREEQKDVLNQASK